MSEYTHRKIEAGHTKQRYPVFDTFRGLTLLSMLCYHAVWDLVYLYGFDWQWYRSEYAYIWQQSICWSFILLSGFCFRFGSRHLKRGLLVSGAGLLITVVTSLFLWEERVVFGVLTMLGCSMLLMIPLDRGMNLLKTRHPKMEGCLNGAGLVVSVCMFFLTKNVNDGYVGYASRELWMPEIWYRNMLTAFLGFPGETFFSTDYFSLVPWFFLFVSGYFLHGMIMKYGTDRSWLRFEIKPLAAMGKHSLLIYMLHQPLLYVLFWLVLER